MGRDDARVSLSPAAAALCRTIEHCGGGDDEDFYVPVATGETLRFLADYCEQCVAHPPSSVEKPIPPGADSPISTRDQTFLRRMTLAQAFHLLHTAHFMQMQHLVDVLCAMCAFHLRGKSMEQLCGETARSPWTQEEAKVYMYRHPWVYE